MPVYVPESVFDKYYDVIDSTFQIFGVDCQLVSINKVEELAPIIDNNIPEKNSINAHRVRGGDYEREHKIIKEIEVLTDIRLKIYWDMKQWIGIAGDIKVPDGSIQTIGFMTDLPNVLKAKALIVHKGIKEYKELRFERYGEHTPMGLRQNRYFSCLWKRV
ncbi:hypothetical protein EB001_03950 [bacterium]|nr:hypothetical protein [bacterium]